MKEWANNFELLCSYTIGERAAEHLQKEAAYQGDLEVKIFMGLTTTQWYQAKKVHLIFQHFDGAIPYLNNVTVDDINVLALPDVHKMVEWLQEEFPTFEQESDDDLFLE